MAGRPFGPWLTPSDKARGSEAPVIETWRTGKAIDEFTPIYAALAKWTDNHGPLPPSEVDLIDLSVVAALMGVTPGDDEWDRQVREVMEARKRGERVQWPEELT